MSAPALLDPPVGFAIPALDADEPLAAMAAAVAAGAAGLALRVWLTSDGVPVVSDSGRVRSGRRRRPVHEVASDELPSAVPPFWLVVAASGSRVELLVDVGSGHAVGPLARVADELGIADRLWMAGEDLEAVTAWRQATSVGRMVHTTRLRSIREGPERRAAELANRGVDGISLHHTDWSGGMTTLFHRFGRLGLAWGARFDRELDAVARAGVDGVSSINVAGLAARFPGRS